MKAPDNQKILDKINKENKRFNWNGFWLYVGGIIFLIAIKTLVGE
jgi:hypothetical protein